MTVSYYLQVLFYLAVLAGFLYLVLYLTRVTKQKRFSGEVKLKDRTPLSNTVSIAIVEVRGTDYLMSIGSSEVTLLKEL